MKNYIKLFLLFGIIIFYIIVINIFASLLSFSYTSSTSSITRIGGDVVEIGVSQSVSVSVTRAKKWFGQFHSNNEGEYLNLFYICNIPTKIKNYNFIWFHIIFIVTIILLTILMFTKKNYKGGNNLENEKLFEDSNNIGTFNSGYDT